MEFINTSQVEQDSAWQGWPNAGPLYSYLRDSDGFQIRLTDGGEYSLKIGLKPDQDLLLDGEQLFVVAEETNVRSAAAGGKLYTREDLLALGGDGLCRGQFANIVLLEGYNAVHLELRGDVIRVGSLGQIVRYVGERDILVVRQPRGGSSSKWVDYCLLGWKIPAERQATFTHGRKLKLTVTVQRFLEQLGIPKLEIYESTDAVRLRFDDPAPYVVGSTSQETFPLGVSVGGGKVLVTFRWRRDKFGIEPEHLIMRPGTPEKIWASALTLACKYAKVI